MFESYRSRTIPVGNLLLGGDRQVRIQSMTNTDTNDIEASLAQCRGLIDAGAELVRLTVQGKREVASLGVIKKRLHAEGFDTPLVADIHFKPGLALKVAPLVEKIRINPGNYLRGRAPESLLPALIDTCRHHGTAIRIGVNHGSLSPAIMNEFGDSPEGMAESALRFLRICKQENFERVVVSLKSSNPRVMVQSVRLLVSRMMKEGLETPLHLGVTEAGDGEEGMIRSTVGMAPLLLEGMGDTVRVSLTGPPEEEIPVARDMITLFRKPVQLPYHPFCDLPWDPFHFERRRSHSVSGTGNGKKVKIVSPRPPEKTDLTPDLIGPLAVPFGQWQRDPSLLVEGKKILLLEKGSRSVQQVKQQLSYFCSKNNRAPVLYKTGNTFRDPLSFMMQLAGELGFMLVDGAIDAVWVENPFLEQDRINDCLLTILQATGARISRTEYIACPSCGRTQFDIVSRLREVRAATSHLTSLKIAVMGCIVNGPGEMADAHYGYVGAGPGRITLYKGRTPVRKNIPESEALDALVELMKQEGDWKEP
ncbi:MAG: (E)-4-hydroxy-3-methylbut-2-enyl-diphosphate synthase [Bacteroidales bacterium]